MKVITWTLLIINFSIITPLILLMGCSLSSEKKSLLQYEKKDPEQIEKTTAIAPKKVEAPLISGPTKKNITHFIDKTKEYGLAGQTAINSYAVDFNNDGHTDLVLLPDHYSAPKFFQFNHSKKKFEKLTYNPFSKVLRASFLNFIDFNNDGVKDVILGTLNQKTELSKFPLRLFAGVIKKGRVSYSEIKDVFDKKILPTATLVPLDFDLDGNLDLFQGNWFDQKQTRPIPMPDNLLRGEGGFIFKDITGNLENEDKFDRAEGIYPNARPTFGASTCDLDQNGYPDILTASSSGYRNKLWLNIEYQNRGRLYKNYGIESGYGSDKIGALTSLNGGNTFHSICADYNNDGIFDIAVGELSHAYDNDSRDRSSILTGATYDFPPKYIRTEYYQDDNRPDWSQGDRRALWADIDRDGLLDLIVVNSGFPPYSRLIYFNQHSDNSFEDIADSSGLDLLNPSGTVVLDINDDGRLDIFSGQTALRGSEIPRRVYLFENNIPWNKNRSLRFHLIGQRANRDGIGSSLILNTNNGIKLQWAHSIFGPQPSQIEEGVHFGLGREKPNYIEVRWPSLIKNRAGRETPNLKRYDLSKLQFNYHLEVYLCENGRYFVGTKKSCE